MQRIKSSLAWRLTLWFLLLSFLPIGTVALFVRHTVADSFAQLAAEETLSRARVLAGQAAQLSDGAALRGTLVANSDRTHAAFIFGNNGEVLLRPDPGSTGSTNNLADKTLKQIVAGGEGSLRDEATGHLVGYSEISGRQAVAVMVMDGSAVSAVISRMETASVMQLAAILAIVSVLGGLAILVVIGPIQRLTKAAEEVGAGNLQVEVDCCQMEGELEVLAAAFNRMTRQLRESYDEMERRVADRTRDLAALNSISTVVARSLDLRDILDAALEKIVDLLDVDAGAAFRLAPDGQTLELMAQRGVPQSLASSISRLPAAASLSWQGSRSGQPVVLATGDPPDDELRTLLEREGLCTVISIPLVAKDQVVGVVEVGSRRERKLTAEEPALLSAIGQQVGMAVENARLYENAEESAVAAERNRLARDLHDAVTQILFSASLIAEVLPRLWQRDPAEGQRRLAELRELTRGALAEMRMLLLELRPAALTESSLDHLLRHLAEATTGRARLPVALTMEGECRLPPDVQVGMYRIAQEALNNVAKHSGATEAAIELRLREGLVELAVKDNGRGFDPSRTAPDHLGLGIIKERAQVIGATVAVRSEAGQGTEVVATWSGTERDNRY